MALTIELFSIKNLTLDIDILASQKLDKLEVSEYSSQDIVVNLPQMRIGVGSLLSMDGRLFFNNREWKFAATGQVTTCVTHESGKTHRIEIHFRQIDNDLWDQFLTAGKVEQQRVDTLFRSMKGVS